MYFLISVNFKGRENKSGFTLNEFWKLYQILHIIFQLFMLAEILEDFYVIMDKVHFHTHGK